MTGSSRLLHLCHVQTTNEEPHPTAPISSPKPCKTLMRSILEKTSTLTRFLLGSTHASGSRRLHCCAKLATTFCIFQCPCDKWRTKCDAASFTTLTLNYTPYSIHVVFVTVGTQKKEPQLVSSTVAQNWLTASAAEHARRYAVARAPPGTTRGMRSHCCQSSFRDRAPSISL
jgi:hypothetical protein